jgi:hypothetical protein
MLIVVSNRTLTTGIILLRVGYILHFSANFDTQKGLFFLIRKQIQFLISSLNTTRICNNTFKIV